MRHEPSSGTGSIYLRSHEITIAEVLRENGCVTGHFGKWQIGSLQPGSPPPFGEQGFDEWLSKLNFFDQDSYLTYHGEYVKKKGMGITIAADATIDFLTKHHDGEKPIFVVNWFPAPHDPFGELPQEIEGAATLYHDQ